MNTDFEPTKTIRIAEGQCWLSLHGQNASTGFFAKWPKPTPRPERIAKDCRTTAKDCNFCQRNLLTLLHAATVAPLFQKFPRPQKLAASRCAGLRRIAPHCNFLAKNSIDGFPLGWVRWFLLLFHAL